MKSHILFWNNKYGVVALYNWSMGPLLLFENFQLKDFCNKQIYQYIVEGERRRHYIESGETKF
jgi:hypothetical protein